MYIDLNMKLVAILLSSAIIVTAFNQAAGFWNFPIPVTPEPIVEIAKGTNDSGWVELHVGGAKRSSLQTPSVKFVYDEETWSDAREICNEQGGDLYIPDSHTKMNIMLRALNELRHRDTLFWVGAINDEDKPDSYHFINMKPFPVAFWLRGYPQKLQMKGESERDCVHTGDRTAGLQLKDADCNTKHAFVCAIGGEEQGLPDIDDGSTDSGWVEAGGMELKFVYQGETWHDGRDICRAEGGDLFIPDTHTKINHMNNVRNKLGRKDTLFWVGAVNDVHQPNKYRFLDLRPVPTYFWAGTEYPQNSQNPLLGSKAKRNCASTGDWENGILMRDAFCSTIRGFICAKGLGQQEGPGETDSGWVTLHIGGASRSQLQTQTVKFVYKTESWSDARDKCKEQGGDIYIPDSINKINIMLRALNELGHRDTPFWVGAINDEGKPDSYHFANMKPFPVAFWLRGYPQKLQMKGESERDCIHTGDRTAGRWLLDADCQTKLAFVCSIGGEEQGGPDNKEDGKTDSGWMDLGGLNIKFVYEGETWNDGRDICRAEGGDLFIPDTHNKINLMNSGRNKLGQRDTTFWVGAINDGHSPNTYRYLDLRPIPIYFWAKPEYPQNIQVARLGDKAKRDCVTTGDWENGILLRDSFCSTKQGFICARGDQQ